MIKHKVIVIQVNNNTNEKHDKKNVKQFSRCHNLLEEGASDLMRTETYSPDIFSKYLLKSQLHRVVIVIYCIVWMLHSMEIASENISNFIGFSMKLSKTS